MVKSGRNGLAAQGCRGRQGPGEQVKGGKTASAGMGGGGQREWKISRWTGSPRPEEGGELGAKSGAAQSKGGGCEGSRDTETGSE